MAFCTFSSVYCRSAGVTSRCRPWTITWTVPLPATAWGTTTRLDACRACRTGAAGTALLELEPSRRASARGGATTAASAAHNILLSDMG